MTKKIISILVILAAFLVSGLASADTLDESQTDQVANLAVETLVPEKVTVKVVMTGGSFKIGTQTYQNQTTVELPYASDLTVTPVDGQLTKAALDFAKVTPAYQLEAGGMKVSKIRTDGTVTLTFEKVVSQSSPQSPQQSPQATPTQGQGATIPQLSETDRVWLSLLGLGLVFSLVLIASKRRRATQGER
ncbi:hypothetical protein [Pseudolactococcus reticulitermitis]|uniref:Gram-positive cocci surface proteins LPxTG domain-containing protein n=1 Tax=Pseudolactococcus reticulitermitis TaxID=2025039 RepID=A0A224X0X2_9LACT|nr:hypothetical protein [Lactococcus reticulitermitis]GAX47879.1 hypothetical protein RsY01_1483 [Lactococcus reticulitermitis]